MGEDLIENAFQRKSKPKPALVSYTNVAGKRPTWNGKILYDTNYSGKAKAFRKHVSIIWMYGGYEENEDSTINTDYIRCGECGWRGRIHGGSTTSLMRHLATVHMIEGV